MKIKFVDIYFGYTQFKSRTSDDTIVIKKFNSSNHVMEFTNIDILIKFIDIYDYATIMVNPTQKKIVSLIPISVNPINLTTEDIELIKSNNITVYHYKMDDKENIYLINNEYWKYDEFVSKINEYYTKL